MWTRMNTDRQTFKDNFATVSARTALSRIARVDLHKRSTSIFRFVGRELCKHSPCGVANALVQAVPVAVLHVLNVQIFKRDDLILIGLTQGA